MNAMMTIENEDEGFSEEESVVNEATIVHNATLGISSPKANASIIASDGRDYEHAIDALRRMKPIATQERLFWSFGEVAFYSSLIVNMLLLVFLAILLMHLL